MRGSLPLVFSLLLLAACQRKAPGPEECLRFSHRVSGVSGQELQEVPKLRERVDELTRQCLTTPFDRELLSCVEQTGRMRTCTIDFQRRRQRRPAELDPEESFIR